MDRKWSGTTGPCETLLAYVTTFITIKENMNTSIIGSFYVILHAVYCFQRENTQAILTLSRCLR